MKKAAECLAEMKDRQARENARKVKEHDGMYGWQKLAHEKAIAMKIAESIQLSSLDKLFAGE